MSSLNDHYIRQAKREADRAADLSTFALLLALLSLGMQCDGGSKDPVVQCECPPPPAAGARGK